MDPDATLAAHEQQLVADLATLTAAPPEGENLSFGKRIGDGTSLAVDRLSAVAVQEQLLDSLTQVRRARTRVADGTYGTCEVCGEPIPAERLEARPWAARCVRHA
ncbi:TraR/DksA family transcriptional regulator [Phycicoccus avicenniae]|uniref:TraR/DksA family transcriptional regulator n=1 Tax=Phycicoccus avicenniae TaxID=2828860 RepID=UPI003D2BD39D